MANVKTIVAAHLSQRQRSINKQVEREDLLGEDRLLCNIIRVDSNINVPFRPGFVWCQEYSPSDDTSPFHAFNDKVQAREGLTVWVGPGLGGRREVLDWNNSTIVNTPDYNAQKYLPLHHSDHEWPDFKPGPDVVNVYPRSLSMLRTYPGEAGGLTISASPLRYIKGNALILFPGKNSLDISASQPASGLARFVGIYLDPDDNTLKSVNGATTGDSPAITPDSPAFPESAILSANVRLNGDQTTFSETDMVDVRQILDSSGAIDGTRVSKLVSPDGLTDPVLSVDNNGDIGAGVTPSSVAKLQILDASAPQLRLEFDATHFLDLTVDTNHDLTAKPSATGQVKFQPTTNSDAFFQVLTSGGDRVFSVDTANRRVAVNTLSPDAKLEVEGITGAQLRLTFADSVKFVDFTVDTNHDLTITPSSTGQVIFQPTADSVDFFQILDADGGVPIFQVDSSNERITINATTPLSDSLGTHKLTIYTTTNTGLQFGRFSADAGGPILSFVKSRGALGVHGAVLAGDRLGTLVFSGSDGTDFSTPVDMAQIYTEVDAVTGAVFSGRIKLQTTNISGTRTVAMTITDGQDVGIGATVPLAKLHIDQASTTAAIPVAFFDQADISEEMFEFATTIGVGNAIEAVGAKTLTVTHFIKVTLPGALTRYIEVGTIA